MFKSLLKIGLFGVVMLIIIASLAFSTGKLSQVKCDALTIIIPEGSPRFIDEEEIARIINKADDKLFEKRLDGINTEVLEQQLEKVSSIKKAEVFRHITGDRLDFKGKLIVEVVQREPVFRVLSGDEDYYLDEEGITIPGSGKFSAHVLIVTGKVNEKFARERLLPFVRFVEGNEFWKAQIKQINVEETGEIVLVPLIGDQLIEFGEPEEYREKLRNLKALYEQGFTETGWGRYNKISLKYKNQVVCTKK